MNEKVNESLENLVDTLLDYTNGLTKTNDDLVVASYLDVISGITQNMKRLFDMGIMFDGAIVPKNNKKEIPKEEVGEIE